MKYITVKVMAIIRGRMFIKKKMKPIKNNLARNPELL